MTPIAIAHSHVCESWRKLFSIVLLSHFNNFLFLPILRPVSPQVPNSHPKKLKSDVEAKALNKILPHESGLWWHDEVWAEPEGLFACDPSHWFQDESVRVQTPASVCTRVRT